jgi:tetratricopeptide (TPR) repeat protein
MEGGGRRPDLAVPFLLEALQRYEVLERDDWATALGGGLLGKGQVEHIRRSAYEELLWLAADLLWRREGHRSGQALSPAAAARAALVYLGKAETAHRPTQALYALRARCRAALGEEAAAQADRQLAKQTPPALALDHYQRGLAAFDAKQLAEGVQAFEAALRVEPTHYWSLMKLGYCLCDLGRGPEDFAGAARVFTGCILKRPDHAHAYYCRANAYNKMRRCEEAVADYSRAIELDPNHAWAWHNRGQAYGHLGQWDNALTDFSRAIDLDPKDVKAWINRGVAYRHLGQWGKSLADCSQAIELDPKHALAWFNRANANSRLARFEQARTDFQTALELAPSHADARGGLAWLLATFPEPKLRDPVQAVRLARKAVQLKPQDGNLWNTLGVAHYRAGEWKAAVAALDKSEQLMKGGHACNWLFLAMAHQQLDNRVEACKWYERAVGWLAKNQAALARDDWLAEELRRFRREAEEVLQLKKK